MGRKIKDLSNKKFNYLKVIEFKGFNKNKKALWLCECQKCGNKVILSSHDVQRKDRLACGCMRGKTTFKWDNHNNPKLYKKWWHIINRCQNANDISFHNYDALGIKVCDEWQNYDNFYKWSLENGYEDGLEIDRINVYGNYQPSNCRFITKKENSRNKRNSKYYIYRGEIRNLGDIADELGVKYKLLWQQIKRDGRSDIREVLI